MFDWSAIKSAIDRGMTPTEIAKTLPNTPSRQAIEKRAKREGWQVARLPESDPNVPVTSRDIVLTQLRNGATLELAARASGITERTLYQWRQDDPTFDDACKASRSAWLLTKVKQIDEAPDWKAAAYLLERAPETRDQYGTRQGDSQPLIVLNINREQVTANGKVIEHGET